MQNEQKNSLSRILERLSGQISSSPNSSPKNLSPLKQKSLIIFQKLDTVSDKYVKHPILKKFIMTFIRPHVIDVISNKIPEPELKKVLWECHDEIDELKNQMDIIKEIKTSVTDKVITDKIMSLPKYKELGEMLL